MKRPGRTSMWRRLAAFPACLVLLVVYNEFIVYYLVLLQCQWPALDPSHADVFVDAQSQEPLRVMLLADTHLLGSHGHWFDKLRREWQMRQAFQASMVIHSPEVVFILGDALDEGKWASDANFRQDVQRFKRIFSSPANTNMQVIVGNHDIGFHHMIDKQKRRRFGNAFGAPSVRQLEMRGNLFVLLNSMALEGDECDMCAEAEQRVKGIARTLQCAQAELPVSQCQGVNKFLYSKPILLQHFPMYRGSLSDCTGPDGPPPAERFKQLRPKLDCLSQESSQKLLKLLSPRLLVSAHTHFGCYREHADGVPEWTIPSFSWRNINQPAFILARFTPNNFAVSKCYMPRESTVAFTYAAGLVLILAWFCLPWRHLLTSRTLKTS